MKKSNNFRIFDPMATGLNIVRLRTERNLTVADLQDCLGFYSPQAIYKWQQGKSMPSIDNLFVLSNLFGVPIEEIVICTSLTGVEMPETTPVCSDRRFHPIDLTETGKNIASLCKARSLSAKDLQAYFKLDGPQAVYKWKWGHSLPSLDNLYGMCELFGLPISAILVGVPLPPAVPHSSGGAPVRV